MGLRPVTEEFRRKLRTLRGLCQDIVELRRGDHSGGRLNLEQERIKQAQEKTEEEVAEHFSRWAANPEIRDWICRDWVSPEERERRLRQIFGLAPRPPAGMAAGEQEADPVKPDQSESNPVKPVETDAGAPSVP